ncbi:MAG: hypothetical protein ACRDNM_00080 [Gaiellaceae bacterium]
MSEVTEICQPPTPATSVLEALLGEPHTLTSVATMMRACDHPAHVRTAFVATLDGVTTSAAKKENR